MENFYNMIRSYLTRLTETSNRGDAREESYYPVLVDLLNRYCELINKKGIHITTLPKKTEAGNPDFRIWDGKQHITGYIEAKDLTKENLDIIEETKQLKRYLHTFPNLILTNFLEFRLYRNGEMIDKVLIGRPLILNKLRTVPPVEKERALTRLLDKFFSFSVPEIYNAKNLAIELARRTRFLKDVIALAFEVDDPALSDTSSLPVREEGGVIQGFYEAFKKYLMSSLTEDEFADLYAQTITYGLFAARTRSNGEFNRKLAYDYIPQTIGILRDVFQFVSLGSLPPQMEWIIDDISEILSVTDINKILHEYFHEGKGKDPIIHFYETFLAEYDPKTRERRGVYYTPEPVVSYIARSLHSLLKGQFDKPDGFADKNVTVLDPAAGTLTFIAEAARFAVQEFVSKYGEGGRKDFIKNHILKNFYAFELMMAPYAIGHLKMSFLLEEFGYRLQKDDRVKLYLTNTLEMEELPETRLPGMSSLSEESHLAGKVKKEQPILVILGNPPYSVSSVNKSVFIEQEMDVYKEDVRNERNIQPLSDDYIKFIRFAQWKIEKDGRGVIGMITNNSYLSGLIHRGMRKSLLKSFNEIYILNLHGNSRIGERSPDGSKDENVFDIQQGVSISLFVKNRRLKGIGKVFYHDVYGSREGKYEYLNKYDVTSIKWKRLEPSEPYYFFVEKDFADQTRYATFWSIRDIFIESSSGVKTHRDHFVIGFTKEEVKQRMRIFVSSLPDEIVREALDLRDTHDFKLKEIREKLRNKDWKDSIIPYSYRPFDDRYICYVPELIDRDRVEVMKHFCQDNIGICVTRQLSTQDFFHTFVTGKIADICLVSIKTRETGYIFPLYLYTKKDNPTRKQPLKTFMLLFEPEAEYGVKKPNLSAEVMERLIKAYKKVPSPEEIFYYIYAILYSEAYRTKYSEFLKIDFPRVPLTKEYRLFKKVSGYGKRLVDLHLLRSEELSSPLAKFRGKGDNRVDKLKYESNTGCIYINKEQYFEGISHEVWSYRIGGYQVCDKWLKDRKGRILSLDEIQTYCRIVTAIGKTIEIQKKIDAIYNEIEETA